MPSITVTVDYGDERKRRERRAAAIAIIIVTGSLVVLVRPEASVPRVVAASAPRSVGVVATRPPVTSLSPQATPPAPSVVDTATPPAPIAQQMQPLHRTPPVVRHEQTTPAVPPTPESAPAPTPAPVAPLLPPNIEPRHLSFHTPGAQKVAISNPNDVPIHIDRIVMATQRGRPPIGYQVNASDCNGVTLAPHAQCRITVFASPIAIRLMESFRIDVYHDGLAKPATNLP